MSTAAQSHMSPPSLNHEAFTSGGSAPIAHFVSLVISRDRTDL